jgi:hypothetical protein
MPGDRCKGEADMVQITSASDVSDRLRTKCNMRRRIDFHHRGNFGKTLVQ